MPLYEFDIVTEEGAILGTTCLLLPVNQRDAPPAMEGASLVRHTVPSRVAVIGLSSLEQRSARDTIETFARIERRMGTGELQRRLGDLSPEQVKRAWGNDAPPPDNSRIEQFSNAS